MNKDYLKKIDQFIINRKSVS